MITGWPCHRRLLAIILGMRRRQSGRDEINGVGTDGVDALVLDVLVILVCQFEPGSVSGFFQGGEGYGDLVGHIKATVTLNDLFDHPIHSVPDAEAQRQHNSWSTKGRLFEFPGKNSDCQDAENYTNDFGGHMVISFAVVTMMQDSNFLVIPTL